MLIPVPYLLESVSISMSSVIEVSGKATRTGSTLGSDMLRSRSRYVAVRVLLVAKSA